MRLRVLTILLLLALGAVPLRAEDGEELFSDDFSSLDSAWGLVSDVLHVDSNKQSPAGI